MNDRTRAIEILKQAQDLLAENLTERILESREEIIEDAVGLSYTSEIQVIYDQLGERLLHVTQLLSGLPAQKDEEQPSPVGGEFSEAGESTTALPEIPGAEYSQNVSAADSAGPLEASPANFQSFVIQVHAGDLKAAGVSLAPLLGVDDVRGQACAKVFRSRIDSEPDFITRAMQLRGKVAGDNTNDTLMLLNECFGLQGFELIGALQTLKARMSAS